LYGFDQIDIDDYYFQIEGVTNRERSFVRFKSHRTIKDMKANYVDAEIENDPRKIIYIGLSGFGKLYERKVYSLLDMLGYVGGLF